MSFPKFLVADNTDSPDAIFIVHTEFPAFILNLENDEVTFIIDRIIAISYHFSFASFK